MTGRITNRTVLAACACLSACAPDRELPEVPGALLELRSGSPVPVAGAQGVSSGVEIRIGVTGSVSAPSVEEAFALLGPDGSSVDGDRVLELGAGGVAMLVFVPFDALEPLSTYRAVVDTRLQDIWGRRLAKGFEWTFTTGAASGTARVGPTLVASSPLDQETGASTFVRPLLRFSQALDEASLVGAIRLRTVAGVPVAGELELLEAARTLRFRPTAPLVASTDYVVEVDPGVQSIAGTPIAGGLQVRFSTTEDPTHLEPPTLVLRSPESEAVDVAPGARVVATFRRVLRAESIVTVSARTGFVNDSRTGNPAGKSPTPLAGSLW